MRLRSSNACSLLVAKRSQTSGRSSRCGAQRAEARGGPRRVSRGECGPDADVGRLWPHRDAVAVVLDLQQLHAAVLDGHGHGGGAGVEAVLQHLLDGVGGPVEDLAGGDAVHHGLVQPANPRHAGRRAGHGGRHCGQCLSVRPACVHRQAGTHAHGRAGGWAPQFAPNQKRNNFVSRQKTLPRNATRSCDNTHVSNGARVCEPAPIEAARPAEGVAAHQARSMLDVGSTKWQGDGL